MIRAPLRRLLPLALLAAACTAPDEDPAAQCRLEFRGTGEVRVFVFGHAQRMQDNASYRDFRRAWRRHALEVKPCLARNRPNLLVFPEDAGLGALLIGPRGAVARRLPGSTEAFLAGAAAYAPGLAYYARRFPGTSPARQLMLAASDPVWRAVEDTFGGMARDLGAWVLTSANVADVEETREPGAVASLRDPSARFDAPALRALSAAVPNVALLFAPDGTLAGRSEKVFLTDPEEQVLDLSNGSLANVTPLWTPFARLGVAISRDAFYPPYMQRLEDLDADLVVQPEAFSHWTTAELQDDEWLPDVFLSSGWLHTQRHRTFRHSLNSVLVAPFFDLSFDGQAHITAHARPDDVPQGYVGSQALPGFLRVGPWVLEDPPGSLEQRRRRLRDRGQGMRPSSRSSEKDLYRDSVVAADLKLGWRPPVAVTRDASLPRSGPLSPSPGIQRNADVASDGRLEVLAAWQEQRAGAWHVRRAWSHDGARTWNAAEDVSMASGPQRRPSVCVARSGAWMVVLQEGQPGSERIRAVRGVPGSEPEAVVVDDTGGPQWEPDCGFAGEAAWMAWTDHRAGFPVVRAARWDSGAAGPAPSVRVDDNSADGLQRLDGSQVQPAFSPAGGHLVWADYRARSWDIRYARVDGERFTRSLRVDGADSGAERLHSDPVVLAEGPRVTVAFTDLHSRRGHSDIGWVVSDDGGSTWGPHHAVPGGADDQPTGFLGGGGMPRFRPTLVAAPSNTLAFFQDLAPGKSALVGGPLVTPPVRLDDTADAPVTLTRPRAASVTGAFVVVFEDDREGADRVYFLRTPGPG